MSVVQFLSCCRVSPKLSASPDFWMQSDSTCRNQRRRHVHHCRSRLGHNSFCFLFDFESSSQLWSSLSSWNSWYSKWSWNGWYWTNNSLWSTCLRVDVWCQCNGFEFWGPNSSRQTTLWVSETCLIVGLRPFIITGIRIFCNWMGMRPMFVGMTLVCLIGMV